MQPLLPVLLLTLIFFLQSPVAFSSCTPTQIHISLSEAFTTNSTSSSPIRAIFHTTSDCPTTYIALTTPAGTVKVQATSRTYFQATYESVAYSTYIHYFDFPALELSQTYKYKCYGTNTSSTPSSSSFTFYLPSPNYDGSETKVLMFGDMDYTTYGLTTFDRLITLAKSNFTQIAAFIHNGDIAYNLEYSSGTRGDTYMKNAQSFAAVMPYMLTAGNHEANYNFSNFNARFQMPMFEKSQNHYYSFNIGNMHFTSFNLDLIINIPDLESTMLEWLEQDLIEANNNRDKQPWIIAFTHRPIYCSSNQVSCRENPTIFKSFTDLLDKYNVDVLMGAHIHIYERMFPIKNGYVANFQRMPDDPDYRYIVNPTAPVYVLQGMAGHRGDLGDPADAYSTKKFSYMTSKAYSYATLTSSNETHLLIENYESAGGTVNDYFYIVKSEEPEYACLPSFHLVKKPIKNVDCS